MTIGISGRAGDRSASVLKKDGGKRGTVNEKSSRKRLDRVRIGARMADELLSRSSTDLLVMRFVVNDQKRGEKTKQSNIIGRFIENGETNEIVLESIGVDQMTAVEADAFAPDAKARALLRGVMQAKQDLIAAGGAFSMDEVCALLGDISRQAVHKKVQAGALLAVRGPHGRTVFPTFQFTSSGPIAGLSRLSEAFESTNPWMLLNFLVHPDDRLGDRRPIDVLKEGDVDAVVAAARSLGQQGD